MLIRCWDLQISLEYHPYHYAKLPNLVRPQKARRFSQPCRTMNYSGNRVSWLILTCEKTQQLLSTEKGATPETLLAADYKRRVRTRFHEIIHLPRIVKKRPAQTWRYLAMKEWRGPPKSEGQAWYRPRCLKTLIWKLETLNWQPFTWSAQFRQIILTS